MLRPRTLKLLNESGKGKQKIKKGRETRHRITGMYIAPFGITEG
jgi:hypothetical protein